MLNLARPATTALQEALQNAYYGNDPKQHVRSFVRMFTRRSEGDVLPLVDAWEYYCVYCTLLRIKPSSIALLNLTLVAEYGHERTVGRQDCLGSHGVIWKGLTWVDQVLVGLLDCAGF